MQKKIEVYLKGLVWSFIAVIIFAAFEWIQIGTEFNKFLSLLMVATVFWTLTYFTSIFMLWFILLLTSSISVFGIFLGFGIIAYGLVKVATYLLPAGVATFTNGEFQLLVIGAYYCFSVYMLSFE